MTPPRTPGAHAPRRGALLALLGLCAGLGTDFGFAGPTAASEDKAKKKGGGLSYIQLEPINASLNPIMGRRKILSIECGLDVPDGGLRNRAEQSRPILRDSYLRWVLVYAASLSPGTPPNPDAIEAELQRETDHILGRPGARFILGTVMVN
jgi:flagellar basal body-associated protein FliL